MRLVLQLTPEGIEKLRATTERSNPKAGGFQSLLHKLCQHVEGTSIVLTDPKLIERVMRYQTKYGAGGFQSRFMEKG